MADPSKMKVVELKAELKQRGLSTTGRKAELVSRLEGCQETSATTPAENQADQVSDGNTPVVVAKTAVSTITDLKVNEVHTIQGRPVSGRTWKYEATPLKTRVAVKQLHSSWEQKMEAKRQRELVKAMETELKESHTETIRRQRIQANLNKKRKLEGRREAVAQRGQVTKDPKKLRKMSRKQHSRSVKR